ncbi:hypothetical protein PCH_Pc12g00770 [Penicillium rubens Wisconsin 54-1255]|uniref:Uncharacterized protein n=1 Tax=Penicillium rubens (strain ATCC 28089 / DSM 1075 / NRRL 1951 / Wisconsin 54-1255) TaxID=500485 RepID=B6GXW0_PENRW|nr:hypothetical protein PCH_Pc12g00770 [Penicillium rubens Wisconsin 54-1255]
MKLRLTPEQRQQQFDDLEAILICEYTIGEVEDYGYRTLYRYLCSLGLFYTKTQIEIAQRFLRPEVVKSRLPGARRSRSIQLSTATPGILFRYIPEFSTKLVISLSN